MNLNKLLVRQIQKHLGQLDNIPGDFHHFLAAISESYDHYEKDHKLLERSIDLSSSEMIKLNQELKEETKKLEIADYELRMLFENIDETFFSVDIKAYKLSNMSQACKRIYGYEPQDFFSAPTLWQDVIHPDDKHVVEDQFKELAVGNKVLNQYRITHKDGKERWIENRVIPTLDKNGSLERIDGITTDITERKKAEKKLIESEANLKNILENTDTGYVLLDSNANILSFNRIGKVMALNEIGEVLQEGRNYIDIMPAEQKMDVKVKISQLLLHGKEIKYEVPSLQKNGSFKWFHISMHPIFSREKQILGLSVGAMDITKSKKAEIQIKRSNDRYKLVTKATRDVIWDWELSTNKIYRSPNYKAIFGFSENTSFTVWTEDIHPEDRERIQLSLMQKINDPFAIKWEDQYRLYKMNGEVTYVQDRGYIVRNKENKAVRIVGAMSDITNEKNLSIERDKVTSDLVQRNRDLEQFSYIISHNLRLPVTNIIGLVNLIQGKSKLRGKEHEQCINGLALASSRLDGVIKDLNYILQVRHEINERKETVKFSEIVEDIKISILGLIQKEDVQITTDFREIDHITTIKSYLYSIFFNLISNSIKYRNGEAPVINISSRRINNKTLLTFSDNSVGIDLATQAGKIFGLYNKFHFHKEGKGIGLYMTKTQVEILGGEITIESAINKGATFLIEFQE